MKDTIKLRLKDAGEGIVNAKGLTVLMFLLDVLVIGVSGYHTVKLGSSYYKEELWISIIYTACIEGFAVVSYLAFKHEKADVFDKTLFGFNFIIAILFVAFLNMSYFQLKYKLSVIPVAMVDAGKFIYAVSPAAVMFLMLGTYGLTQVINYSGGKLTFGSSGQAFSSVAGPAFKVLGVATSGLHAYNYGVKVTDDQFMSFVNAFVVELLFIYAINYVTKEDNPAIGKFMWIIMSVVSAGYILLVNLAYFDTQQAFLPASIKTLAGASYSMSGAVGAMTGLIIGAVVKLVETGFKFNLKKSLPNSVKWDIRDPNTVALLNKLQEDFLKLNPPKENDKINESVNQIVNEPPK